MMTKDSQDGICSGILKHGALTTRGDELAAYTTWLGKPLTHEGRYLDNTFESHARQNTWDSWETKRAADSEV